MRTKRAAVATAVLLMTTVIAAMAQKEAATWLQPGDAALLSAAKAGYEGQKIRKPIDVYSRSSGLQWNDRVQLVDIVTPITIAGQLGAEQRKVFGPAPEDSKVLVS
jgi:hypothetical protein